MRSTSPSRSGGRLRASSRQARDELEAATRLVRRLLSDCASRARRTHRRSSSPECGAVEPGERLGRLESARLGNEPREPLRVDVVVLDGKSVADSVAFDASRLAPQSAQKCQPGSTGAPHLGHPSGTAVPQFGQKRLPARSGVSHCRQIMTLVSFVSRAELGQPGRALRGFFNRTMRTSPCQSVPRACAVARNARGCFDQGCGPPRALDRSEKGRSGTRARSARIREPRQAAPEEAREAPSGVSQSRFALEGLDAGELRASKRVVDAHKAVSCARVRSRAPSRSSGQITRIRSSGLAR
jgi:hypothetical protein